MDRYKDRNVIDSVEISRFYNPYFLHPNRSARNFLFTLLSVLVVAVGGVWLIASRTPPSLASSSDYTLTGISSFLPEAGRLDWSSPQGEWLAYDHYESDGYWDVYRIRSDGTDNECLTCDRKGLPNRNQGNPAYHPSGRYLLFQAEKKRHNYALRSQTQPGSGVYNDLWVLDLQTDKFYRLTDVRSRYPAGGSLHAHFSHDGSKLLWGDLEKSAGCYGDWRLAVADFVTDTQPHLENIRYYQPGDQTEWYESQDWSLDDSTIYFSCAPQTGQDDRTMEFCSMDLNTQALTRLTQTSGLDGEVAAWDEHGKVTPRGDAIVWMSSQGHEVNFNSCNFYDWLKTDLWMMNNDGSGQTKLTHFNDPGYPEYDPGGVIVSDHSWHPDGSKLAVLVYYHATQKAQIKIFGFDYQGIPSPSPTPTPTPGTPSNTGWLGPTANLTDSGGDNDGFEFNPEGAYEDGQSYARNLNGPGDRHRYSYYNINLPIDSTVEGIEVRADWWLDKIQGNNSTSIELSWDGGVNWTVAKSDSLQTTEEHTGLFGGAGDDWGHPWTVEMLTNENFQVRVTNHCYPLGPCRKRDYYLDWVPVKIYYR